MPQKNIFSIYIHVPWCRRRCPYCNFYLTVGRPAEQFVDAILSEWKLRATPYENYQVSSVYFGGGTPSLLSPAALRRIVQYFADEKTLPDQVEITLEANPEDLTDDYVGQIADVGINRISLGIQSFDDQILRHLGRKHSRAMAIECITRLRTHGFTNISVDLILGVPNENPETILSSLTYLRDAQVSHVSAYLLTIEEGTQFARRISDGRMAMPIDDMQADIYTAVQQELSRLGYVQYDISSYGQPGFFSQHNQAYWAARDYLGLGPGAHSMRRLADGRLERTENHANLAAWLKNPCANENWLSEILSPTEAMKESLAFGLRNMVVGIDAQKIAADYDLPLPEGFWLQVEKHRDLGWLNQVDQNLTITATGALFADAIMRDILCC